MRVAVVTRPTAAPTLDPTFTARCLLQADSTAAPSSAPPASPSGCRSSTRWCPPAPPRRRRPSAPRRHAPRRPAARACTPRTSSPRRPGKDYEPSRYLKLLQAAPRPLHRLLRACRTATPPGTSPRSGCSPASTRTASARATSATASRSTRKSPSHLGGADAVRVAGRSAAATSRGTGAACASRPSSGPRRCSSKLFIRGTPEEEAREMRRIRDGQSILDDVRDQVKSLNGKLGDADRAAARPVPRPRSARPSSACSRTRSGARRPSRRWTSRPRRSDFGGAAAAPAQPAVVRHRPPRPADRLDARRSRCGSARRNARRSTGVTLAHHDASHHGQEPAKLEQLGPDRGGGDEGVRRVPRQDEGEHGGRAHAARPHRASSTPATWATRRRTTTPTCRSCSPAAGSSTQGHVAFDRKNNTLLSNLFVRMLHQMGIEAKSFGASTGVVSEV